MNTRGTLVPSLLLVVVVLSSCVPTPTEKPTLTPITVQLAWTHQSQFAGMYAATRRDIMLRRDWRSILLQGAPKLTSLPRYSMAQHSSAQPVQTN